MEIFQFFFLIITTRQALDNVQALEDEQTTKQNTAKKINNIS